MCELEKSENFVECKCPVNDHELNCFGLELKQLESELHKALDNLKHSIHVRCVPHVAHLCATAGVLHSINPLDVVQRLRTAIVGIRKSTKKRSVFEKLSPEKSLLYDCLTRWNSTWEMITRACEVQRPLNTMMKENPKLGTPFNESEWEELNQIATFLALFEPITRNSSSSSTPTISTVVPSFLHLQDRLEDVILGEMGPAMAEAAKKAHQKLEKYNKLVTDSYFFASFLDPRLRVSYFEKKIEDNQFLSR